MAGEAILPDATNAVRSLTKLVEATRAYAAENPGIVRNAFAFALAGGAIAPILGLYLKLRANVLMAAAAKKILTAETRADTAAEAIKAGVAAREGAAIAGVVAGPLRDRWLRGAELIRLQRGFSLN